MTNDMDRKRFAQLVERSLKRLPKKFRDELENIAIEVEAEPPDEVLDDLGIEDDGLYGLYQGTPLTEREWNYGNVLPDRITIYRHAICAVCTTDAEVVERVRRTVIHEVAHHFGIGDGRLRELGW